MPDLPHGLPARLRVLRQRAGLSASDLARASGTTAQTVLAIERGANQPRIALARRLADALAVTLDDLAGPSPVWPD